MAGVAEDASRSSTGATAHVELRRISKHFGGVLALDGISLEIPSGTIHALVGENGAGKSTLGKIVAGAIRPTPASCWSTEFPSRSTPRERRSDTGSRRSPRSY